MKMKVYGGVGLNPINLPPGIEVVIFPLRRATNEPIGGNFPMLEYQSVESVRRQYPLSEEQEKQLGEGQRVNVFTGYVISDFAEDAGFPEGAIVEHLE